MMFLSEPPYCKLARVVWVAVGCFSGGCLETMLEATLSVIIFARAVGVPVRRRSGGRLAMTLVATINVIISFSILARACGVQAVGVPAVDCWQ